MIVVYSGLAFSMKRNEGVFEETWYNFNKDQFEWKLDFDSIDKDCDCWTCCRHSRSYIHHLFCVKDMLGHVMLMHHNLYQMERFMSLVQENVTFRFANT
jgi:queuine tRNA-ribosyltransferase